MHIRQIGGGMVKGLLLEGDKKFEVPILATCQTLPCYISGSITVIGQIRIR